MAKSIAVKVKHIAPKKEKSGTPQLPPILADTMSMTMMHWALEKPTSKKRRSRPAHKAAEGTMAVGIYDPFNKKHRHLRRCADNPEPQILRPGSLEIASNPRVHVTTHASRMLLAATQCSQDGSAQCVDIHNVDDAASLLALAGQAPTTQRWLEPSLSEDDVDAIAPITASSMAPPTATENG